MASSPITTTCTKCKHEFSQAPKQSFLGFKTIVCPECKKILTYPLTTTRIIIYWVIFIWMTFQVYITLTEDITGNISYVFGQLAVPGMLLIPAIVALFKNWNLNKSLPTKIPS